MIRDEALQRYPKAKEILGRLAPFITNDSLSALNWEVDGRKETYAVVAGRFLKERGLIR